MLRHLRRRPRGRILDAACGLGQLAGRLRSDGWRAFGLDGEFAAALYANRYAGVPTVVGDMTRLPFRSESFDATSCGETLEHLDDDATAAAELNRVMRPGALCVITVPALRSLWTASDDYYEHRRRYSRQGLRELVTGAGFRVESIAFWGFPVVLAYDFLILLPMNMRRARGKVSSAITAAGRSPILVALVRALFSIDRLLAWLPYGPGLILAATKS